MQIRFASSNLTTWLPPWKKYVEYREKTFAALARARPPISHRLRSFSNSGVWENWESQNRRPAKKLPSGTLKSHPWKWVDYSSPAYKEMFFVESSNPTHGSGWIVQVLPTLVVGWTWTIPRLPSGGFRFSVSRLVAWTWKIPRLPSGGFHSARACGL